jgi:hypothetical protein
MPPPGLLRGNLAAGLVNVPIRLDTATRTEGIACHLLPDRRGSRSPVEHFLSRDFRDARSVSLRFTRRLPTGEALAKRGVNDYRNVIYTVKQSEDGRVLIWLDYQEYFDPQLSGKEWAERPFGEFVTRRIGYFQGEFRRWLQMLLRPDEAA